MNYKIVIIDDDPTVLESIKSILDLPNLDCYFFSSPIEALKLLKNEINANLIIVDVWIPEMDGIQFIKTFRKINQSIPILSISGHANLSSSFEIAKLGANDFLEKPFTKDTFIYKIKNLLNIPLDASMKKINNDTIKHLIKRSNKKQKTIKKSGTITGIGIHSGNNTGIILSPLPENSGIIFEDIITGKKLYPHVQNLSSAFLGVSLNNGDFSISVIEHLMATLFSYDISNILIKVNKEVPVLDGSSIEFCQLLEELGIQEQNAFQEEIIIDRQYEIHDDNDSSIFIKVEPYDGFYLSYHFDMKDVEVKTIDIDLSNNKSVIFKKELAPARTFVSLEYFKEITLKQGLGKGLSLDNALIISDGEKKNLELRLENELTRHKILDICGDMMLLSIPIKAKITASKSGHRHTMKLLNHILSSNI